MPAPSPSGTRGIREERCRSRSANRPPARIPATARPKGRPPSPDWLAEKKVFARRAEVFAGYADYPDHEIGRVIPAAVEDMGKLDNTLIIYITGDNGTRAEAPRSEPQTNAMQRASAAGVALGRLLSPPKKEVLVILHPHLKEPDDAEIFLPSRMSALNFGKPVDGERQRALRPR
jgi:hypothetical protein